MKRSLLFFILTSGIVVILIVCILIIKNLPDHPEQSSSTSTAAFVEFKEKKQNLLNDSIPSNLTDDKNKYFYWDKEKKELKPTTTPSTKASYIKPLAGLANNNLPVQYELKKGQLTIKDNGKTLWQTPLGRY
jgi:inner membrane protein involved in colicin E2 resistance